MRSDTGRLDVRPPAGLGPLPRRLGSAPPRTTRDNSSIHMHWGNLCHVEVVKSTDKQGANSSVLKTDPKDKELQSFHIGARREKQWHITNATVRTWMVKAHGIYAF